MSRIKRLTCFLTVFFCIKPLMSLPEQITQLPGLQQLRNQYSGYSQGLFYWYVPSKKRSPHSPIIVFTSGGPGSSSLYGFFEENGPYSCYVHHHTPLFKHSHGHADWSTFSNYVVFDQPMGIGFSFSPLSAYPKTPHEGTVQYLKAIQRFFTRHPELKGHPLYLACESYGATYIALLAQALEKNPLKGITLKGLIVISGWVNPKQQYGTVIKALQQNQLINNKQHMKLQPIMNECTHCHDSLQQCFVRCQKFEKTLSTTIPLINLHDIHHNNHHNWKKAQWISCLNNTSVRHAIHAKTKFTYYPMTNIWNNYGANQLLSVAPLYKQLVKKGLRVLVFSGRDDVSPSGYAGTAAWLHELNFKPSTTYPWIENKVTLGRLKTDDRVTWVTVNHAGHTVPTDQPKIEAIIKRFVYP